MLSADAPGAGPVTRLLLDVRDGERGAFERLFSVVYDELHQLAQKTLREMRTRPALHARALVHELYLKLADHAQVEWQNRAHFYSIAIRAMRQILVDDARQRSTEKRGHAWARTTLTGKNIALDINRDDLLALDAALDQLDERQRRVVEYRFFGGLTEPEIAELLGITERTVQRDWVKARAWLYRTLYPEQEGHS